jgi:DNA modification methylase
VIQDPDFTLLHGGALEALRTLPGESVHTVITSPPYWSLRDYGVEGQLGLEPTLEGYIAAVVEVFREVRRVLRRDGTVWLVLGDSYTSGGRDWREDDEGGPGGRGLARGLRPRTPDGLKPKDLAMVPARVALALVDDGWYLRQDVIWDKPNAMPESVTDRPSSSHEHVLLLARSQRYFYDQDAVREPYKYDGRRVTHVEGRDGSIQHRSGERWPGLKPRASGNAARKNPADVGVPGDRPGEVGRGIPWEEDGAGRNLRSVWRIPTKPFPGTHFAVFPPELVRLCVLAGTSERGCCPECGAPWERVVESAPAAAWAAVSAGRKALHGPTYSRHRSSIEGGQSLVGTRRGTTGWRPTCGHYDELYRATFPRPRGRWQNVTWWSRVRLRGGPPSWPAEPCTVADPFLGTGTTAEVARTLGRCCVGVELKAEYVEMIARRTAQLSLLGGSA